MRFLNNLDLNLPPRSYQPSNEQPRLLDLNEELKDVSDEENLQHVDNFQRGQREPIDLNQPFLENYEQYEFQGDENLQHESRTRQVPKKIKVLSNDERRQVYLALLSKSVSGKLRKGTIKDVALMFSISNRTISRIWRQAKTSSNNGVVNVNHRKSKNCGRKRIMVDPEQFKRIPLRQRTSLVSLEYAIKVSKSTLHRRYRQGKIRRHTSPVKPYLKDSNKQARVRFCLSMIDRISISQNPYFVDMYNVIHIDEKWFYISRKAEKYYLLPEECDPERTCKSKIFLTKVMFLATIARPRFDADGNEVFSGKIGVFPFVTEEVAKRSSVNRVAGTLEMKPITSIGRDIGRSFLINKVLPAILEKWPDRDVHAPIFIQQDNARTHIDPNDTEFRLAVSRCGLNIQLYNQPPNSPDLNVLDLGFFSAIQALHYKEASRNVKELVASVERAFNTFSVIKSNRIFLTLQSCMVEIMKTRGANRYKIPHIKKASLERNRRLPIRIKCSAELVEDATKWLNSAENV